MPTRRTFIAAGVAGAATLAAAGWWRSSRDAIPVVVETTPTPTLAPDALAVITAITPVFLEGALPGDRAAASAAVQNTVADVGVAIAGLPPAAQEELGQLFALLGFPPARIALARVASPWAQASRNEIAAFLDHWRTSRFLLLHSAYSALHQLVFAAWYGNPEAWPAIGYPGPPKLVAQ